MAKQKLTDRAEVDAVTKDDLIHVVQDGVSFKATVEKVKESFSDEFATSEQGAKADIATQPADIADFETTTELNSRDTANRARANHTGTQAIATVDGLQTALNGKAPTSHTHTASQVTDFNTAVSANIDVAANTSARHAAVTVTDSAEIDFTLTGQDITAELKSGSIDATKLDASINTSLSKADTATQPADIADFETTTQLNARDTANRSRANHTGTQAASTVTGLADVATTGDYNDLDNLPDLSVYDNFEPFTNEADFPATGNADVIYLETSTGTLFRWTGSAYVTISAQLALGETSSTAYRGDRGKIAYDHSQVTTGNPHDVTKAEIGLGNVPNTDFTAAVNANTTHRGLTNNPHSVTKAQVGLGNVDNTSDANKPVSTATQTAFDLKQTTADAYLLTSEASSATPTITGTALRNDYVATALVANATLAAPSGTANAGAVLRYRITASGGTRTIGYNAGLLAGNETRTTSLDAGETLTQIYERADGEWRCVYDNVI